MLTPKRTHAQMPLAAAVLSNLDKLRQSVPLPMDAPGLPEPPSVLSTIKPAERKELQYQRYHFPHLPAEL